MAIKRSTGKSRKKAKVTLTEVFDDIKKKLYSDAADIVKRGFSDIVNETPVDTGYAASNWKVSWSGTSESSAPPKDGGPYRSKQEVILDGDAVVDLIKKYGFENDVKFFNATPYINQLENGVTSNNPFFIKRATTRMKNEFSNLRG
jgi:hypothetical protein